MSAFEYTAVDANGRQSKGVLEGDTPKQVRQTLRDQGLFPVNIGEVSKQETQRDAGRFTFRRGLSPADLTLVTRQLATLVHSGLPLDESLQAISEQTEQPRVRSIVMGVRAKVMEGHTLADALGDFPNAFPELYRATVAAGEQSGHLDTVLDRLADYTESREQQRSKTMTALLLPTIQFVVCILIVLVQLIYVVPKIVKQFQNAKHELPVLTRLLIGLSNFLQHWGIWLVIALISAFMLFRRWLKEPSAQRQFQKILMRIPLVGKTIRGTNTYRFARTFATLTSSAVPVLEALRIAGTVVTSLPMRDAVDAATARVREGAPIAKSLGATKIFPPMMIHLIASGESSGELEQMLDRAATNQEREMERFLTTLVDLIGPIMTLVMAALVMLIVLALLLPIFQLNQLISA